MRSAALPSFTVALLTSYALAAPDLSSPKSAYRSYHQALQAGDLETIKACVIADEKRNALLAGQVTYAKAERRFRDSVLKAFPAAAKQLPDPAASMAAAIEKADVKIDGDRALLRTTADDAPIELKKADNVWKLDLMTLYTDDDVANVGKFRTAVAEVMDGMIAEIDGGKFASFDAITQALQSRVLMRTALPQEDATTQATTLPAE